MLTTTLLTVLLLSAAQTEEACKSCWNATCADLKEVGLPACKATAKRPKQPATSSCEPGKVKNADTQGRCCWPGQAWSTTKGKCVGEPECSPGFSRDGAGCVAAVACPAGATWNGKSCEAKVSCPAGTSWSGTSCAPDAPAGDGKRAGQTKAEPKTGLTWVWMPSGSFHYGCEPQDTQCDSDEKPGQRRSVEGFWMMQTETTVAAYTACAGAGVCPADQLQGDNPQKACNGPNGRSDHPMNCVSWDAAGAFCRFVGGRLPSAVEWEYAAKSGSSRIYPWGDDAVTGRRANFCDANCPSALSAAAIEFWQKNGWITFGEDDGWAGTAPVGSFPRGDTPWGLKDMAGNVWELTSSAYGSSKKEARGGSWSYTPGGLRAGYRDKLGPGGRLAFFGFRCAQ